MSEQLWHRVQDLIRERGAHFVGMPRRERGGRPRYLLAGLLRCEECGSGFHTRGHGDRFECSGRHHRGAATCSNALRVPAADLEARVLGAIRDQILIPEHALYMVAKTVERLREQREEGDVGKLRDDRVKADAEVSTLIALAGEMGGVTVPELAARLKSAQRERTRIDAELRAVEIGIPDAADLRELVERRVEDLRASLASDRVRDALHALFRGERLTVRPDPDAGFRISGTAWLRLAVHKGPARVDHDFGRVHGMVAGGGFEPPTSGL